jgi:hypothetical protein
MSERFRPSRFSKQFGVSGFRAVVGPSGPSEQASMSEKEYVSRSGSQHVRMFSRFAIS